MFVPQWPGHKNPEIVVSKRLPRENCNCIGELAIEFAKECVEALKVGMK